MLKTLALLFVLTAGNTLIAQNTMVLDTKWIPSKPEVLTYRTTSSQGNGSFQTAISKSDSTIEVFTQMMSPGFAKTISGFMTLDMVPLRSVGKIIIGDQVQMDTETSYETGHLHTRTVVKPYNRTIKKDTTFSGRVVDPSQLPFLARFLQISKGAQFEFTSLNPQTNTLYRVTLRVIGEESVQNIDCYKMEWTTFEGHSIQWIEKVGRHRFIRIEQPDSHRLSELIQ